jgi:hypothetical protein
VHANVQKNNYKSFQNDNFFQKKVSPHFFLSKNMVYVVIANADEL